MIEFMMPDVNPFASSLRWLFYMTTAVSMLIGPVVVGRVSKARFLSFWILLGVIFSLFPMILLTSSEYEVAALLILWGFAFGIGFPSCLALIPTLTSVEERGRAGGAVFFATYAISPLLIIAIKQLDVFSGSFVLAAWRSLCIGAFLFSFNVDVASLRPVSYCSILRRSMFLLYFLPWLAFCLINYFERQVLEQFFGKSMIALMVTVELVVGSLFCLIGGWLMDLKGRKWVIIMGLVALGLGYALLGLFPLISAVQAFYMIMDGIAFGIFTVAFIFVVWGDISNGERGEKFYGIGGLPVLLAPTLSLFAAAWLRTLDASNAFSLASFFLFLAVIPIFFAPELLPECVLKERELRRYVEEVKKVAGRGGA
ncbi:MAG: hypothetical protein QMC89_03335 [Candidatus Hodarchaeaceae archaeon]|nr:hypothetical protein [Candidatus Hodarchaeaceae archaeon]